MFMVLKMEWALEKIYVETDMVFAETLGICYQRDLMGNNVYESRSMDGYVHYGIWAFQGYLAFIIPLHFEISRTFNA